MRTISLLLTILRRVTVRSYMVVYQSEALWSLIKIIKNIKQTAATNSNDKAHFTFDLTFRMLHHTSSEVTVEQIQI